MRSREKLHSSLHNPQLLSEVQLVDDRAVTLDVGLLEVAEKVSSVADHLLKSATAVVVLVVVLEVFCKILDPVSKERDLYLGRPCVALMSSVLLNNCLLFVFQHFGIHLSKKYLSYNTECGG